jgi:hypothetical protein
VSELLATLAPIVSIAFILSLLFFLVFILLVEVFPELASEGGLRVFAATPPHLARPRRLVRPAAPVIVFLLFKLNFAICANPLILHSTFPPFELVKLSFQGLQIIDKDPIRFLQFKNRISHLLNLTNLLFVLRFKHLVVLPVLFTLGLKCFVHSDPGILVLGDVLNKFIALRSCVTSEHLQLLQLLRTTE